MPSKWLRPVGVGLLVVLGLLGVLVVWEWRADLPREAVKARWGGPPSRYVDVDGMSVHYRDEGSGPPLVLLHGTGSSLFTWDAWAAANLHAIAPPSEFPASANFSSPRRAAKWSRNSTYVSSL